jgi:hypothetical protein
MRARCHPERSEGPFRAGKGPSACGLGMTRACAAQVEPLKAIAEAAE